MEQLVAINLPGRFPYLSAKWNCLRYIRVEFISSHESASCAQAKEPYNSTDTTQRSSAQTTKPVGSWSFLVKQGIQLSTKQPQSQCCGAEQLQLRGPLDDHCRSSISSALPVERADSTGPDYAELAASSKAWSNPVDTRLSMGVHMASYGNPPVAPCGSALLSATHSRSKTYLCLMALLLASI